MLTAMANLHSVGVNLATKGLLINFLICPVRLGLTSAGLLKN